MKEVKPLYDGRSLLNVSSSILNHFGVSHPKPLLPGEYLKNLEGSEVVILLLIDGFGQKLFEEEGLKHTFFRDLKEKGFYKPITTVFPSSTAPAVGTINSALSPLEHGLPEWHVYFRELDCIAQSLPFVPLDPRDASKLKNPPHKILFNQETIYSKLKNVGVASLCFMNRSYSNSFYNKQSFNDAISFGYRNLGEFMDLLSTHVNEQQGRRFYYAYWDLIDGSAHHFGPGSDQVKVEIKRVGDALNNLIFNQLKPSVADKTSIILTADHGQVPVDPKATIYLDEIKGLKESFDVSPKGNSILPSGSPRGVFLHIKEDRLAETVELLDEKLRQKAHVMFTDDFIQFGIFGEGIMHPEFISRVGNVLILPTDNNNVWYHFYPGYYMNKLGYHGGQSSDEMFIPFACTRVSQLIRR